MYVCVCRLYEQKKSHNTDIKMYIGIIQHENANYRVWKSPGKLGQEHDCWLPDHWYRQAISSHGIDCTGESGPCVSVRRDFDSMSDLKYEKLLKHLYGFPEKLAGVNSPVWPVRYPFCMTLHSNFLHFTHYSKHNSMHNVLCLPPFHFKYLLFSNSSVFYVLMYRSWICNHHKILC